MPRYTLRLETPIGVRYLEWSTIVDAPVTFGLTLEEYTDYWIGWYGKHRAEEFPGLMEHVYQTGTSCRDASTVAQVIAGNRAGVRESELSLDEIIDWYCVKKVEPARVRKTEPT